MSSTENLDTPSAQGETPSVNANAAYTPVAKGLHWLMAVLILGLLALGLYMHELPLSPQKLQLYSWTNGPA